MLAIIDNYDSFTYNLVHYLGELGAASQVYRNDSMSVEGLLATSPSGIVLSPGPCTPDKAGICVELIRLAPADLPILGVCLGHQAIGQAFGGRIAPAPTVMHGKLSTIRHGHAGVFAGLADPFRATRYHSLIVDRADLPRELEITAETEDAIIMGLRHRERPVHGVQFHPESVASQCGHQLLRNFLRIAGVA